MPQLWTETFVTQYFWLLLILFTFYYFISTDVIPKISNNIKARQISEEEALEIEEQEELNSISQLFNKQSIHVSTERIQWETVQTEWLASHPEENEKLWVEAKISEETLTELQNTDEEEQTLEEFVNQPNQPN